MQNKKDEVDAWSKVEGKRDDLVVRSGRISDGVMPYTANGLYSLRPWCGWDVHKMCRYYRH